MAMDTADAELLADFVIESQEGLANIEQQMLAIEAGGDEGEPELVNAVFRTMHTIKGTAGFLGLDRIGSLAHGLEEVLDAMRNRQLATSSELVTTILSAADCMKGLIDAVETSNEAEIGDYVAALQSHKVEARGASTGAAAANAADARHAAGRTEQLAEPAPASSASEAVREFLIECYENLDRMEHELIELEQNPTSDPLLRGIFRTMHTIKGGAGFLGLGELEKLAHVAENLLSELRDGTRTLAAATTSALLAAVGKCREGLALVETNHSDRGLDVEGVVRQLILAGGDAAPSEKPVEPPPPHKTAPHDQPAAPAAGHESTTVDKHAPPAGESTIRVDVGLLDKLMTRVGELVLARNQIVQYTSRLEDAAFVSTAQRLNLITTELQESVMKTRMQPIGNVWTKFPRVVRDLAAQLGKQVRIEMEGKETELDKTIVEAIKDPLTHLVRNSIDHGIEPPTVRAQKGKPVEGRLLLRAYHEGGQVNIEITDDGAGLNLDRIRQKAVERGLISTEQAARLSDRDAAQLIFAPGFSTAETVTSVSGRGVGMDVVKTNIERIGGAIDVRSVSDAGATVRIKIPLTLAIIPALVVTNDGDRYAIPQVSLLELVRLEGADAKRNIEFVHGAPVYRLRGKLLPLVYLSERLGLTRPADAADDVVNIVVLRANDRQFGLVVDKVNDTEEIVVKPLSHQLKGLSEFAGATIMGDGAIALILDVMGLAVAAGLAGEMREQTLAAGRADDGKTNARRETLLVVDLGDTRRFALPTSMISRLERVARSDIEQADGREVIQYRGDIMPLVRLSSVFGGAARDNRPSDDIQVVVYADQNDRFGLVVDRIIDIVETDSGASSGKPADDNLLGTLVIQQRVTDVVDLRRLARHSRSNKAGASPT
ncbi:MAG TPA: chemotaxis protein CheW [Pirellulales bacterium]